MADGATLFEAESVHDAGTPEVVGVDVWITKGFQDSVRRTYLFVWDGTKWANSTPEGSGVTVTTSVT